VQKKKDHENYITKKIKQAPSRIKAISAGCRAAYQHTAAGARGHAFAD
jgi:hypothetical protein